MLVDKIMTNIGNDDMDNMLFFSFPILSHLFKKLSCCCEVTFFLFMILNTLTSRSNRTVCMFERMYELKQRYSYAYSGILL